MIDEVVKPDHAKTEPVKPEPADPAKPDPATQAENQPPQPPPKPAELDQDAGGGYNPDHTDPQT